MFAVTPYFAERFVIEHIDGKRLSNWERCRVIGVGKDEDGDPVYVCEIAHNGTTSLVMEMEVRRMGPDPL